jgi:hypothetical protein
MLLDHRLSFRIRRRTRFFLTTSASSAIPLPPCTTCASRMLLVRIKPYSPGYYLRTFECPDCELSLSEVVKG